MNTTRRDALAGASATAAFIAAGKAVAQPAKAKTRFRAAAVTPCDKDRRFDPGAMRDLLAHLKVQGADGVVVLGTTGEFPSFTTAERETYQRWPNPDLTDAQRAQIRTAFEKIKAMG